MPTARNFLQNEKILFQAEVIALSNLKITCNYTTRANFKRDFPKINLKIYLLQILSLSLETFGICSRDHFEGLYVAFIDLKVQLLRLETIFFHSVKSSWQLASPSIRNYQKVKIDLGGCLQS